MFAYEAGIKLTAAAGDLDFAALKNNMRFFAKVDITMDGDDIVIRAKKRLTLAGKVSAIVLDDDITGRTPGRWVEHAREHLWVGPDNVTVQQSARPAVDLKTPLTFMLRSHPGAGRVLAGEPYALYRNGAKVADGVTDAQGQVVIEDHRADTQKYSLRLANGHEFELPLKARPGHEDDRLAALGFRADGNDPRERLTHHHHATTASGRA